MSIVEMLGKRISKVKLENLPEKQEEEPPGQNNRVTGISPGDVEGPGSNRTGELEVPACSRFSAS